MTFQRRLVAPELAQSDSPARMGFREVGVEGDRTVVARERLLEAPLPGKRDPEVVAGLVIVRRNLQHLPEQLLGFRILRPGRA